MSTTIEEEHGPTEYHDSLPSISDVQLEKEVCHGCGGEYKRIAQHWAMSDCSYPEITDEQWDILTGFMLGDGSLGTVGKHPHISIKSTCFSMVSEVSLVLPNITNNILLSRTSMEVAKRDTDREFQSGIVDPEDRLDIYEINTKCHPDLIEFRTWYSSGEISFPRDLSVGKIALKYWFASDGALCFDNRCDSSYCQITSVNEANRPEAIVNVIEEHGFDVNHVEGHFQFRIPAAQTPEFLEYIGPPPSGLEYKWEIDDHERYQRLKSQVGTRTFIDRHSEHSSH